MKQQTLNISHTASQRERLKALLDEGMSINPLEAFKLIGTMKLASRISELIQSGYPVKKSWKTVKNRFGEDVRVMEYRKDV